MATPGGGPPFVVLLLEDEETEGCVRDALGSAMPDAEAVVSHDRSAVLRLLADPDRPVDLVVADQGVPQHDRMRDLHQVRLLNLRTVFLLVERDAQADTEADEAGLRALSVVLMRRPSPGAVAGRVLEVLRAQREADTTTVAYDQLIGVMQQLSLACDVASIMGVVRRAARDLTGADGAIFALRDGDECFVPAGDAVEAQWSGTRHPLEESVSGWAMLHRQPAVLPDAEADPRLRAAYTSGVDQSLVAVPIRSVDPIGAISVYWNHCREIPDRDVRLLQALADTTGLAIEKVDQQQRLERRVAERTEELEALTYAVSHDLQAPVRHVTSFTAMAQRKLPEDAGDKLREYLARTAAAADRMSDMVEALLDLSRTGRRDLAPIAVDAAAIARDVVRELRLKSRREVHFTAPDHAWVEADPTLLRGILAHLLDNAWKFTSRRQDARVEFGVEPGRPPGLFVRDNGVGFDPEEAGRLFTAFQRLHAPEEFPGTGVGLAAVKRAVARHGGTVRASGTPDGGATFCFTLGERTGRPATTPGRAAPR